MIAERTGTAFGPAPGSSAKRMPVTAGAGRPAFAAARAAATAGAGSLRCRRDARCGAWRYAIATATALEHDDEAARPRPSTVQSNAMLECSTRRTGPSGASGESADRHDAGQQRPEHHGSEDPEETVADGRRRAGSERAQHARARRRRGGAGVRSADRR